MPPTITPAATDQAQNASVTGVSSAFQNAPAGLNSDQAAAFQKVQAAFAPATPTVSPSQSTQPAKEPAALSSDKSGQITNNQQTLDTLKSTGLTVGQDGLARYSDGSFASAPDGAVPTDTGAWQSGGVMYAMGPATTTDPTNKAINDMLNTMKGQVDATFKGQLDLIHGQYDGLIKAQADVNQRQEASVNQSLIVAGTSRYAPETAAKTMQTQMTYGLQQISKLVIEQQQLVIQAQQAHDNADMQLMDKRISQMQDVHKQMQDQAQKLSDKLVQQSDTARKQQIQSSRDSAVADLISQGVTDPKQMLTLLNHNGVGDFTSKEINDTIANLSPDAKEVHTIMLEAAKNGAPQGILKAIGSSQSFENAVAAAGGYLKTPKTAGTTTIAEQKQAEIDAAKQILDFKNPDGSSYQIPGTKGLHVTDSSGNVTPEGLKYILHNSNVPIATLLPEIAPYIITEKNTAGETVAVPSYGLTSAQQKMLAGKAQ